MAQGLIQQDEEDLIENILEGDEDYMVDETAGPSHFAEEELPEGYEWAEEHPDGHEKDNDHLKASQGTVVMYNGEYYELQDPMEYDDEAGVSSVNVTDEVTYEDVLEDSVAPGYTEYVFADEVQPSHSKGATIMECEFCGVIVKHPSKIAAHLRTHTGEKPFECSICGQRFSQRVPMLNHWRRHQGLTPYECSYGCGKKFVNNATRNAHELVKHQKMRRRGPPRPHLKPPKRLMERRNAASVASARLRDAVIRVVGNTLDVDEVISAPVVQAPLVERVEQPLSAAASKKIDEIIDAVASGAPVNKRKPSSRRPPTIAQCQYCGLMVKGSSKIAAHIRTHTNDRPYSCEICGMSFSRTGPLRMHIKRKHMDMRTIPCTWECGMMFVSEGTRNEHERIVHVGIKRFECTYPGCRQMFSRRCYLMKHRAKDHEIYVPIYDAEEVTAAEEASAVEDHPEDVDGKFPSIGYHDDQMLLDGEDTVTVLEVAEADVGETGTDYRYHLDHDGTMYMLQEGMEEDTLENDDMMYMGDRKMMVEEREDDLLEMPKLERADEADNVREEAGTHENDDVMTEQGVVKHIMLRGSTNDCPRRVSVRILNRSRLKQEE